MRGSALVLWVSLLPCGCALTSKAAPVDIRYFAIDVDARSPAPSPAPARDDARAAPTLSLGRITSSAFLRNPIVVRRSSHEISTHIDSRWTEYPEEYLRRSLVHELFGRRRFVQGLSGNLPTLDVELVAFEEVVRGDVHAGRVQLSYRLHDERVVLDAGVVTAERNATAGRAIDGVVEAIAAALNEATTRVSDAVQTWSATHAAAPSSP